MLTVFVNIGSNLEPRKEKLEEAIRLIGERFRFYCVSSIIESLPWGFESSHNFLNVGVAFKTDLKPEELLVVLKEIETIISTGSHRDAEGNYKDRDIDIDIMAFDEGSFQSDILQVPHRHLKERDFFLIPLYELKPDWKDEKTGETLEELLSKRSKTF